jgi:hypothetical protein
MLLSERDASGPRKGLQAPLIQSNLRAPSFGPNCGQRALNLKGGCHAQQFPRRRPASASRAAQSAPSERRGQSAQRAGQAASLSAAQFQIARQYGFASWPKLKAHVDSLEAAQREIAELKQAIDATIWSA